MQLQHPNFIRNLPTTQIRIRIEKEKWSKTTLSLPREPKPLNQTLWFKEQTVTSNTLQASTDPIKIIIPQAISISRTPIYRLARLLYIQFKPDIQQKPL